jgi:hypothetical protein
MGRSTAAPVQGFGAALNSRGCLDFMGMKLATGFVPFFFSGKAL